MSKSLGNFFTMKQIVEAYGADPTRISLSDAGDALDDANFVMKTAENGIKKLCHLWEWMKETLAELDSFRTAEDAKKSRVFRLIL